jgi:hypothetical protein
MLPDGESKPAVRVTEDLSYRVKCHQISPSTPRTVFDYDGCKPRMAGNAREVFFFAVDEAFINGDGETLILGFAWSRFARGEPQ